MQDVKRKNDPILKSFENNLKSGVKKRQALAEAMGQSKTKKKK